MSFVNPEDFQHILRVQNTNIDGKNWLAFLMSSSVASPFLGFFEFTGNKISLDWYSFSLWTLRCRDSKDLFLRRWSTVIPVVRAIFLVRPAPFNSSRVNPRPA